MSSTTVEERSNTAGSPISREHSRPKGISRIHPGRPVASWPSCAISWKSLFLLSALTLLTLSGCARPIHSYEYTYEPLPPHPSSLLLQQQVEVYDSGRRLHFEAALESSPHKISYVIFSPFGTESLSLTEQDFLLIEERDRFYSHGLSARELRAVIHQFISLYVHSRKKERIELTDSKGRRFVFKSSKS